MPEGTQRVVVGTVAGIEEKTQGWFRVSIAVPGKQYPVKADTKLEALIDKARAVRDAGAVATWTIKDVPQFDQEGNPKINPNSGRQYENHYLDGVEEGAPASGTQQTQSGPEPKHEPIHFADKDRSITRMALLRSAAMVVAAEITSGIKHEDNGLEVMKMAHRFEQDVYRDIDPVPF